MGFIIPYSFVASLAFGTLLGTFIAVAYRVYYLFIHLLFITNTLSLHLWMNILFI